MNTCVVTGSSGLVGRELVSCVLARGYRVHAWQRGPLATTHDRLSATRFVLGERSRLELARDLAGVESLVHCAWDLDAFAWKDIERVNVRGSMALFEAAREAGVAKLVFVSSVSAYAGCDTRYGRAKLAVEEAVRGLGGVSVRPGIVHGDTRAGVFGRLWNSVGARFVPLVDGGRQKLLLIHRTDLAAAIERMLATYPRWSGRTIVLGHPDAMTMRALLDTLARARGRTITFVPVPGRLLYAGLRAAESMGVRLRFRSDSLKTLFGPDPVVVRSEIDEIGIRLRSLSESLEAGVTA